MKKTYEAIVHLLVPLQEASVYRVIVSQAANLIEADHGSVFIARNNKLSRIYSTVPKDDQISPREGGNVMQVYETGEPKYLSAEKIRKIHPEVESRVKSVVIIPLSFHKKRIGVLTMQSKKPQRLTAKRKASLLLFGAVASLAIRNAQLYKQQQEALTTNELFLSIATHELKTPLTSIKGYAQLISKAKQPKTEWSEAIVRNSNRLNEMIQDLFILGQINADQFTLKKEPVDIVDLVNSCVQDFKTSTKRPVTYSCEEKTAMVHGDKLKLYSVVTNILRNAAKYSPPRSPIEVKLVRKAKNVEVVVIDQGQGIAKSDLKKIFHKYFRGKSQKSGLGLGLFIGKRITDEHQGKIRIQSQVNKGTEVTVSLPLL